MTTEIQENCAGIVATSEILNPSNQTQTITVTHNCSTTYDALDYDDLEAEGDSFLINPEALGLDSESLADGVYHILVEITDEDGNIASESKCVLVDCSLSCDMIDTFTALNTDPENIVKALSYHALKIADSSCEACSCTDMCTLYNAATETDCEDNAPCGCN